MASSLRRKRNNIDAGALQLEESMTLQDYVDEAEICCEQARIAGRQRRFGAARGLFETATSLYRRAMVLAASPQPALLAKLSGIEAEMATYADLARSLSRPIGRSS